MKRDWYKVLRSHRRYWTATLVLCLGLQNAAAATVEIGSILADKEAYEGKSVHVAGWVKSVNYAPEIRNGQTLLSFNLVDATGQIKVINQNAAMLGVDDEVRVTGVFHSSKIVLGVISPALEIDASRGSLEIVKSKTFDEIGKKRKDPVNMAVATTVVDTPWSFLVGLAGILSALAAVATTFLMRSRRFNVGLKVIELERGATRDGEASIFRPTVRLISTEAMKPQLLGKVDLKIDGRSYPSEKIVIGQSNRQPLLPIAVDDEVILRISFKVEEVVLTRAEKGYSLLFRDAWCKKAFEVSFDAVGKKPQHQKPSNRPIDPVLPLSETPVFEGPELALAPKKRSKKKDSASLGSAQASESELASAPGPALETTAKAPGRKAKRKPNIPVEQTSNSTKVVSVSTSGQTSQELRRAEEKVLPAERSPPLKAG